MPDNIRYAPVTLQDLLDLLEHAGNRTISPGHGSQEGNLGGALTLFITGIAMKQVAANLPEGHALASAADQAIADWEDDFCGTPPRPIPTIGVAVSLAIFASNLQQGDLKNAIHEEAGRLAGKAFAPTKGAQPQNAKAA